MLNLTGGVKKTESVSFWDGDPEAVIFLPLLAIRSGSLIF
jgi:hypothetical protein